ncbi:MAG: hypothetical protein FWF77_03005 [Defluviitaleaceae bacterium]|nr:hypothetical protein [Defluviitaleaceae bacterium]
MNDSLNTSPGASMHDILARVFREYSDVLGNMQRTNAILLDLAPDMSRERILVRSFVEIDGVNTLKNTPENAYALAEKKLAQNLTDMFAMERAAALWVVRLFAVVLGLLEEMPEGDSKAKIERTVAAYAQGQVSIGKKHVAAVSADGTVFADGDNSEFQCDVSGWEDIVAVAAGDAHTLGLRADGRVLATGSNAFDECDVGHLTDVCAVYAFGNDSICVLKDGTALAFGRSKHDLSTFSEISAISRYPDGLIGIKKDGALSLACTISDDDAAAEIAWLLRCHDVVQAIATYTDGCVILGKDKRIYKDNQPSNYFAQWTNIIAIADLSDSFAILRGDGTVRVLPYERDKPRPDTDADKWVNIAAIFGGYKRLIGLTRDGNLLVAYTHQGWLWSNQGMKMDYVSAWHPVGTTE